jgi:hypothetical protein
VKKNGTARQATDDKIIRCMQFACWMIKAANVHSEYIILLFHSNSGFTNVPQCCIIRTHVSIFETHMEIIPGVA